jgi:imidazolonepropionase-like amidohydrolase
MGVALAAHDAGVAVYAGTDAGAVAHGLIASEIALLRDAGLTGTAALAAGSWAARSWLGRPGLEEGAPADLVVFPDDPREDLEALLRPNLVMLDGIAMR